MHLPLAGLRHDETLEKGGVAAAPATRMPDAKAKIFLKIEEAGIVIQGISEWGARTKFLLKKKELD